MINNISQLCLPKHLNTQRQLLEHFLKSTITRILLQYSCLVLMMSTCTSVYFICVLQSNLCLYFSLLYVCTLAYFMFVLQATLCLYLSLFVCTSAYFMSVLQPTLCLYFSLLYICTSAYFVCTSAYFMFVP